MTTSHADHALALRLIQETGRTFDEANEILFRFNSAGIHLISIEPPVEPYTGDKAEEQTPAYLAERARLRAASATSIDAEETE